MIDHSSAIIAIDPQARLRALLRVPHTPEGIVTDYLSIGGHFDLWLGSTVGDGIVTRRLFV